jgi:hypothetical protein
MIGETSTTRPAEPTPASPACDAGLNGTAPRDTAAESDFRWYWFLLPEVVMGLSLALESGFRLTAKNYEHFAALQTDRCAVHTLQNCLTTAAAPVSLVA